MRYGVFENGKACNGTVFTMLKAECWAKSVFDTMEEAQQYAKDWLGEWQGAINWPLKLNEPQEYNSVDKIEIQEVVD